LGLKIGIYSSWYSPLRLADQNSYLISARCW
jgi:hypothetical protein